MDVGIDREDMPRGQMVLPQDVDGLASLCLEGRTGILPFVSPYFCGRKLCTCICCLNSSMRTRSRVLSARLP